LTCTSETDSGVLNCNSLNVQKGAITSDGSSFWLSNNTNGYGVNFALYQGSSGNTVLNSSATQDMEFKINNTMYMQIYSNGVVNIGNNQVYNKQLVLYDSGSTDTPSTATSFYGLGVNSSTLRFQVDSSGSSHKFYGGSTNFATIGNSGIIINNGNLTLTTNVPSSGQLGYNNKVSGVVSPTGAGGSVNLTVTTSTQTATLAGITLPSAGVYIIFGNVGCIPVSTNLTNYYHELYINGGGSLIPTTDVTGYFSVLNTSMSANLSNSGTYTATSSTLSLNLYYNRQLISGSGSGTTLNIITTLQYIRIG
jgi:hypothetical protein